MENTKVLDMAVNVYHILGYLDRKNVISINGERCGAVPGYILLRKEMFAEMFPDVKPDENGFGYAEHQGVKICAQLEAKE